TSYYGVLADGTLSEAESTKAGAEALAAALTGTEITGLTNGKTYVVTEYTPSPAVVIVGEGSVAGVTAGDQKITGLTAGKLYVVQESTSYYGVMADGTLSEAESTKAGAEALAAALTGTEITGLTNGTTYLVTEYIPPTEVIIGGGSIEGATAGDKKITGLTAGMLYVVQESTSYYGVLAEGTLSAVESTKAGAEALAVALTGTEITGLTNGKTYVVTEYIP
ncbi:MAG: hypothetical protein FWG42_10210, partial [Clostridiales bacterium]|nr:hypothetical protein [Clostridiales bacterium]